MVPLAQVTIDIGKALAKQCRGVVLSSLSHMSSVRHSHCSQSPKPIRWNIWCFEGPGIWKTTITVPAHERTNYLCVTKRMQRLLGPSIGLQVPPLWQGRAYFSSSANVTPSINQSGIADMNFPKADVEFKGGKGQIATWKYLQVRNLPHLMLSLEALHFNPISSPGNILPIQ